MDGHLVGVVFVPFPGQKERNKKKEEKRKRETVFLKVEMHSAQQCWVLSVSELGLLGAFPAQVQKKQDCLEVVWGFVLQ